MTHPPEAFLTHSLRNYREGRAIARILAASITAADPDKLVSQQFARRGTKLIAGEQEFDLEGYRNIFLLSIGKAAIPMARAAAAILDTYLTGGFVITKADEQGIGGDLQGSIKIMFGGHPLPNQLSVDAAKTVFDALGDLSEDDLVLILLSGGGSALFSLPAEGISLKDLQQTNQLLLHCGAPIESVNTVRKHLSQVKGGQLIRSISPACTISLILSDVIGNPLEIISSGPTVPDPSTFKDAWKVISHYNLTDRLTPAVHQHLQRGIDGVIQDTPKPGDPIFNAVANFLVGSNRDAVQGGLEAAIKEGFQAEALAYTLQGEANQLGPLLVKELTTLTKSRSASSCWIAGGETTVTLSDQIKTGKGGRNLELALSAVAPLDGLENAIIITVATDGEDGLCDAAGAVVTGSSFQRGLKLGIHPEDFLRRHDSYSYFKALDDLLLIGSTQTNVNDLCFLFKLK